MDVSTAGRSSWREERRQDRIVQAQIDRDRETAAAQARIAAQQAAIQLRREKAAVKAQVRDRSRKARAARRVRALAWFAEHTVDLLFVPVIGVPSLLAWTAMAEYGSLLFPTGGFMLPAFSEGAMWAFAARTTVIRRRDPEHPLWYLRLGTAAGAAIGAALNFLHGLTVVLPGVPQGPTIGIVYALISVSGVTAHQLITAGPRRSRAERESARYARKVMRRERAARRAAERNARIEIAPDGTVRLVHQPGVAVVSRKLGRTALTLETGSHEQAAPSMPWPRPAPLMPESSAPGSAPSGAPAKASPGAPGTVPPNTSGGAPGGRQAARTRTRTATRRRAGRGRAVTNKSAELYYAEAILGGALPSVRQIKADQHVGQDRAKEIYDHLEAIVKASRKKEHSS